MQYYFRLQLIRIHRWLDVIGLHPILGLVLSVLLFIALSQLLFYKIQYAVPTYLALSTFVIYTLGQENRTQQLQTIFDQQNFSVIRMIENSLAAAPFSVFLIYSQEYLPALLLSCIALSLSFYRSNQHCIQTIPTPFKKFPFEFIVGFRKSFWMICVAYFLIYQALQVSNYNLGIFAMAQLFFIPMSYYLNPEPHHFVWIHTYRTTPFLKMKYITASICLFIISIFACTAMLLGFPHNGAITVGIYALGYIFVGAMLLAKYATYPRTMNIPQAILLIISLLCPPLLLITLWIFYTKSKDRLKPILEC